MFHKKILLRTDEEQLDFDSTKLLGSLIKNGNKNSAWKILSTSITTIANQRNIASRSVLPMAFHTLGRTQIEVRRVVRGVKRKKRILWIPFPIREKRQSFLKIKWLLQSVKDDKSRRTFSEKLTNELLGLIYDKKKSKVFGKKKEVRKLAISNRSNSHFRW
jgi:ribosomal protein S7